MPVLTRRRSKTLIILRTSGESSPAASPSPVGPVSPNLKSSKRGKRSSSRRQAALDPKDANAKVEESESACAPASPVPAATADAEEKGAVEPEPGVGVDSSVDLDVDSKLSVTADRADEEGEDEIEEGEDEIEEGEDEVEEGEDDVEDVELKIEPGGADEPGAIKLVGQLPSGSTDHVDDKFASSGGDEFRDEVQEIRRSCNLDGTIKSLRPRLRLFTSFTGRTNTSAAGPVSFPAVNGSGASGRIPHCSSPFEQSAEHAQGPAGSRTSDLLTLAQQALSPVSCQSVRSPKSARSSPIGRFSPLSPEGLKQCINCADTDTPQWRGSLCNACALWRRARGEDRPMPLLFPPRMKQHVKGRVEIGLSKGCQRDLGAGLGSDAAAAEDDLRGWGQGRKGSSRSSSADSDETVLQDVHQLQLQLPMTPRPVFVRVRQEATFWRGGMPQPRWQRPLPVQIGRVPVSPVSLATPSPIDGVSPVTVRPHPPPRVVRPSDAQSQGRSLTLSYEPGRVIRDLPRAVSASRLTSGDTLTDSDETPWRAGLRIAKRRREEDEAKGEPVGGVRRMPEAQRLCASLDRLAEVFGVVDA